MASSSKWVSITILTKKILTIHQNCLLFDCRWFTYNACSYCIGNNTGINRCETNELVLDNPYWLNKYNLLHYLFASEKKHHWIPKCCDWLIQRKQNQDDQNNYSMQQSF